MLFYNKTNQQAFMLFSSVTFGFALFSYAFQTYAKASEETIKLLKSKSESLTKAAAAAAQSQVMEVAAAAQSQVMEVAHNHL